MQGKNTGQGVMNNKKWAYQLLIVWKNVTKNYNNMNNRHTSSRLCKQK